MTNNSQLNWKDVLFCSGDCKTKLIKIIDYHLGGLFSIIIRPRDSGKIEFNKDKITKILIIRPGGIGDAVLVTPFIKEIKKVFQGVEIDILAERRNIEIFHIIKNLNLLDNVFKYDNLNFLSLYMKLRKKDYDIVFDTEQWHNISAIFAYFICKKIRIGFNTRFRRTRFYTTTVHYIHNEYEAYNFLNLLNALLPNKIAKQINSPFILLPDDLIFWAKQLIANDKVVAICLSASIMQRFWPADNFKNLTNYLINKGYNVLFLGGRKERKISNIILNGISRKDCILDFVGKTTIRQTAALISSSKFYIGLDTGILHLAYALGIPTISPLAPELRINGRLPEQKIFQSLEI
jgi:ADP-heptose:LPS heptosyltransferase